MTANIFGERFMAYREPAWHNLGKVFDNPMSAVDAVEQSGLNYEVSKVPMTVQVPTPFGVQLVTAEGRHAIVREPLDDDPTYRIFGVVGSNYELMQNRELAEMMDQLTETWKVETVGALGQGETIFMVLDAGESFKVKGDKSEVKQYFLLTDTKDGKTSLKIAFTPVRVVCQNTLTVGLSSATVRADLAHGYGLSGNLDNRIKLLKKLQDAKEYTVGQFQNMAEAVLSVEQIDQVLMQSYPYPSQPKKSQMMEALGVSYFDGLGDMIDDIKGVTDQWVYYCRQADKRREEVRARLDIFNQEYSKVANTAWAVYNSVVENEDFRDGPEGMFESAVFGQRALTKARAMKASLAYVG